MHRPSHSRLWPLVGSCVLLFLLGVSPWGLWERDEGRYADVAREMLERGDYITPRIDGAVFLDKPPLVYWVTAASLRIWGTGETGARFGQLLFAAGILLVTRRLGQLLFDRRRANIALMVLASSLGFFTSSHLLTLDLGLTFFVSLALLCFLSGWRADTGGRRAYLGMFAAVAAGVLTKGPIAAFLVGAPIACYLTLRREWRKAAELPWGAGTLLFLAIAAPWYVAVAMINPEFTRYFFVHENLARFGTAVHRHVGPWYYYLAVAAAGLLPWSLYLPLRLFQRRPAVADLADPHREAPAFLWSWILPGLLFFSVAQSKLPLYVLPLFPAAALLLAAVIEADLRAGSFRSIFLWPSMLLMTVGVGAAVLWRRHNEWEFLERTPIDLPLCLLVAALAAGTILAGPFLVRRGRHVAGLAVAALLWMSACYAVLIVVGRVNFFNETKHFAAVLREERRAGEPVYLYRCYLRGLPFYLRSTVGLISPHSDDLRLGREYDHDADTFGDEASFFGLLGGAGRVFAVMRNDDLQTLQTRVGRPLFILARSESFELVSNSIGAERERALKDLLDSTAFDVRAALDRVARVAPGAAIEQIEIERLAGEPTCTVWAARRDSHLEINIPMAHPSQVSIAEENPAGGAAEGEDNLLRLAPPQGSVLDIPHLILGAAGR